MLGNFIYYNPTKLYFGDKAQDNLTEALKPFGKNILLVYGGGSIKKNGIYDEVMTALKKAKKNVIELSGIMPNPTLEKLHEGVRTVHDNDVDFILAVGGGSTIDYAKALSVSAWHIGDYWTDFWVNFGDPKPGARIIPVGSVLTMAGTGSEMNTGSVIVNHETKLKIGKEFDERVLPKFAILNPKYTYSVPKRQMVAGIFDIMSHIMEQYFSGDDDSTSDYMAEGLMRSLIASSKVAVKDPENYEARSNIMWIATWALNGLTRMGKPQDWTVHMIGHAISAFTDATHGMALAGISLAYYRYVMEDGLHRFARFAKIVWGIDPEGKTEKEIADEGLSAMEKWMKEIGLTTEITSLGVKPEMLVGIAGVTLDMPGGYKHLTQEDVVTVLKASL